MVRGAVTVVVLHLIRDKKRKRINFYRKGFKMNRKGYTSMDLLVTISVVLLITVFVWSLVSVMKGCSGAVDEIQKRGLKSIIEEVWEGEQKRDGK